MGLEGTCIKTLEKGSSKASANCRISKMAPFPAPPVDTINWTDPSKFAFTEGM